MILVRLRAKKKRSDLIIPSVTVPTRTSTIGKEGLGLKCAIQLSEISTIVIKDGRNICKGLE